MDRSDKTVQGTNRSGRAGCRADQRRKVCAESTAASSMKPIDALEIIHDLVEINQQLSWESPVDQELRLRVVKTIEKLEAYTYPSLPEPLPPFATFFAPTGDPLFFDIPTTLSAVNALSAPIRRGHLSLVWSKKE